MHVIWNLPYLVFFLPISELKYYFEDPPFWYQVISCIDHQKGPTHQLWFRYQHDDPDSRLLFRLFM